MKTVGRERLKAVVEAAQKSVEGQVGQVTIWLTPRHAGVLVALSTLALDYDADPGSPSVAVVGAEMLNEIEKALALFPEDGGG